MLPSNTTKPRLGRVVFTILENDPPGADARSR